MESHASGVRHPLNQKLFFRLTSPVSPTMLLLGDVIVCTCILPRRRFGLSATAMTAATPCGCGNPVDPTADAANKGASRARRERGGSFARSAPNDHVRRRRRRRGEEDGGGGEASHAGEDRARARRDRAGSGSDSRRITTSRSGTRKRARSSTRESRGGVQRPPFFGVLPVKKGRRVSAGIKSRLRAWFSRGRLAAAIAAAVLAAASAQEDGGESVAESTESVLVPLASAGLQYTADVTITNSSAVREPVECPRTSCGGGLVSADNGAAAKVPLAA